MDKMILKTKRYLEDSLDVSAEIRPTDLASQLPFFYSEYYRFYDLALNDDSYLLCEGRDLLVAKQVRTQLADLENRIGKQAVYLNAEMNANLRRSLVRNRVPFVIPAKQIYLPKLGIVFNESYRTQSRPMSRFSPLAQVIVIKAILNQEYDTVTASGYAENLDYSVMSISRAFSQLLEQGLVSREERWREKRYSWEYRGRELWDKALPLLSNPASRSIWISDNGRLPYCLAGVSALARYSLLNEDDFKTYATISSVAKNNLDIVEIGGERRPADNAARLQIWKYDPKLISSEGCVDRLSLYLSMKDSKDERIQMSLDEMMEAIKW